MLVLSRKTAERIRLGDSIVVTIVRVSGDKVRLGIEAPPDVLVLRDELNGATGRWSSARQPKAKIARRHADRSAKPAGWDAGGFFTGVPTAVSTASAVPTTALATTAADRRTSRDPRGRRRR